MLEYTITATRTESARAVARCKDATLALDTDPAGRADAFNPAELFLTSIAACMLKGIERVSPMLTFRWRSASVRVHGVRQDTPPRMVEVDYELVVDTDESDTRLDLLHRNVRQFGTIYNTVATTVHLTGTVRRATEADVATPVLGDRGS
jgi:uncharacterized OsmC-like protein